MKRFFTVAEAERVLPFIKQTMARIVVLRAEIEEIVGDRSGATIMDLPETLRGPVANRIEQIQRDLSMVQETGALVKGIDPGLVDFRSRVEGREVLLCWRMGEEHLRWWHELDGGFAARRPIDGVDSKDRSDVN